MRSTESCLNGREEDDLMGDSGGVTGCVRTLFCWQIHSAASNEVIDEDGKPRPPEVALDDSLGAEPSEMTSGRGGMDGVQERGASGWRYIHTTFVIEVSVVKGPIGEG